MVILYEEIKIIKKINEIKFRIDNLMWVFFWKFDMGILKICYVKKIESYAKINMKF